MKHAFWLIVIAFSISAILGGFLSGRAAVPHFKAAAAAIPRHTMPPGPASRAPRTDEVALDDFAGDPAVVSTAGGGGFRQNARLAIVIVDAGHSAALESPFLLLNVPVTLVVDPAGTAARKVMRLALQSGNRVYVQAQLPLTPAEVASIHAAFPAAAGLAIRVTDAGAVAAAARAALRRAGLALFDELGEDRAIPARFAAAGIRYSARSITVDDHVQRSYVAYMLRQAVHLARGRTAVVMARPFPGTLQAFEALLTRARRDGVRFAGLP